MHVAHDPSPKDQPCGDGVCAKVERVLAVPSVVEENFD
jgi:hypothetical protein